MKQDFVGIQLMRTPRSELADRDLIFLKMGDNKVECHPRFSAKGANNQTDPLRRIVIGTGETATAISNRYLG